MSQKKLFSNFLIQDKSIGRFVIILTSILSFLACCSLLFLINTHRQYLDWQKVLNQTFFVELMPESKKEDDLARLNQTLQFLQNTKGILAVRVIPEEEANTLLKPWLGEDEDMLKKYKLPVLIDVTTNLSLDDLKKLEYSLKQQIPFAKINASDAWTKQMSHYSGALEFLSLFIFALILLGLMIIVLTASKMSVVLQRNYIDLLKLMGAPYRFISKQFEKFFTSKVVIGSVIGVLLATSFFHLFLVLQDSQITIMRHFLIYEDVFYLLSVPLFLLLLSYVVSRITTMHLLKLGHS
jgi:cell division protein FtsX